MTQLRLALVADVSYARAFGNALDVLSTTRLTPHGVRSIRGAPGQLPKAMADLKGRNLDGSVASALKARAKANGVSLEEVVRRTLAASVARDREELVRRAKALHGRSGRRAWQAGTG